MADIANLEINVKVVGVAQAADALAGLKQATDGAAKAATTMAAAEEKVATATKSADAAGKSRTSTIDKEHEAAARYEIRLRNLTILQQDQNKATLAAAAVVAAYQAQYNQGLEEIKINKMREEASALNDLVTKTQAATVAAEQLKRVRAEEIALGRSHITLIEAENAAYAQQSLMLRALKGEITQKEAAQLASAAQQQSLIIDSAAPQKASVKGYFSAMGDSAQEASLKMGRLRQSLIAASTQMAGTQPYVIQLGNVLGSFVVSPTKIVALIASLVILASVFKFLNRDAMSAKAALDNLVTSTNSQAAAARLAVSGVTDLQNRLESMTDANRNWWSKIKGFWDNVVNNINPETVKKATNELIEANNRLARVEEVNASRRTRDDEQAIKSAEALLELRGRSEISKTVMTLSRGRDYGTSSGVFQTVLVDPTQVALLKIANDLQVARNKNQDEYNDKKLAAEKLDLTIQGRMVTIAKDERDSKDIAAEHNANLERRNVILDQTLAREKALRDLNFEAAALTRDELSRSASLAEAKKASSWLGLTLGIGVDPDAKARRAIDNNFEAKRAETQRSVDEATEGAAKVYARDRKGILDDFYARERADDLQSVKDARKMAQRQQVMALVGSAASWAEGKGGALGYAGAAVGGAMSGAQSLSAFGAPGMIVGAVGGMVAGLFNHAKKAREAAALLATAQKAFDTDLKIRMLTAQGRTDEAETVKRLASNEKELAEARKNGMSASSIAILKQVQAEEALAAAAAKAKQAADNLAASIHKMRDTMNDLTERAYTAAGQGSAGARIGLLYRQGQEMAGASPELRGVTGIVQQMELARFDAEAQVNAINKAADDEIKALDAQRKISEDGLKVARDQLSAQEKTIDAMQKVVDSLDQYSNSLKVGALSVLSPYKQLQEARSQFDMLTALARGGDLTAAASLPGAGNTLLQSSRAFNASGAGYVADYNKVQDQVTKIRDQFSGQISTAQQSLAELRTQTTLLQSVITAIDSEKLRIDTERNAEIDKVWNGFTDRVNEWLTDFQAAMALLQANLPVTPPGPPEPPPIPPPDPSDVPPKIPNEDDPAITAMKIKDAEDERRHQEVLEQMIRNREQASRDAEASSVTPQYYDEGP